MKWTKRLTSWSGFKWLDGFERWKARALSVLFIAGLIVAVGGALVRLFEVVGAIFIGLGLMICVTVGIVALVRGRREWKPAKKPATLNEEPASDQGYRDNHEELPGWRAQHHSATEDEMGVRGLWLEVLCDSGDKQPIFRCEVTRNGAAAGHWDTTEKFVGAELEDLSPVDTERLLYPSTDFSDAPSLPLLDGDYQVEWYAMRDQLGRQLVAIDRFDLVNGLVDGRNMIAEKSYGYSIGHWSGHLKYQCDDCAHSVLKNRKEMEEHRAASHRGQSAQPAAPASPNRSFTWANMSGEDDSRPLLHSLSLRLRNIGDRWGRGLVCVVESPNGSRHTSPKLVPANQGEFQLNYPGDFDAEPVGDGTYTITWRSFAADDEAVIATRPLVIRQVVLSSFWKGFKPGLRLILEESEAREVVQSGSGKYLSDVA